MGYAALKMQEKAEKNGDFSDGICGFENARKNPDKKMFSTFSDLIISADPRSAVPAVCQRGNPVVFFEIIGEISLM